MGRSHADPDDGFTRPDIADAVGDLARLQPPAFCSLIEHGLQDPFAHARIMFEVNGLDITALAGHPHLPREGDGGTNAGQVAPVRHPIAVWHQWLALHTDMKAHGALPGLSHR